MWCDECHFGSDKWVPFDLSTQKERITNPETGDSHLGNVTRGVCNQCGGKRVIVSQSPFKDTVG